MASDSVELFLWIQLQGNKWELCFLFTYLATCQRQLVGGFFLQNNIGLNWSCGRKGGLSYFVNSGYEGRAILVGTRLYEEVNSLCPFSNQTLLSCSSGYLRLLLVILAWTAVKVKSSPCWSWPECSLQVGGFGSKLAGCEHLQASLSIWSQVWGR